MRNRVIIFNEDIYPLWYKYCRIIFLFNYTFQRDIMAEIRSTLDMVMERAARMAARAGDVPADQEAEKQGMRLVTEFMNEKQSDLPGLLQLEASADQVAVRRGMTKALLRNIVLPRDEMLLKSSTTALSGLIDLFGETDGEVASVCSELSQLLEQYSQHKEQIKRQLEDAIRAQLAQQLQEQTGEPGDPMKIDPTRHPQYQKEWSKALASLNDQYTQAFDQRKQILMQRFNV